MAASQGELVHGTTHEPPGDPRCSVVLLHGFKGYKDYGCFPWLATRLAEAGCIAHRCNFSHSGMAGDDGPFTRLDLFEADTWNRQVEDIQVLADAHFGSLPGVLVGHSRGGVACLLAAGRRVVTPAAVVSMSAPATCNPLDEQTRQTLLEQGSVTSSSSRTGQDLKVGADFLQEQLDDPAAHDLLALGGAIDCPLTLIHGDADLTVSIKSAAAIAAASTRATVHAIGGGDHVFNTPNPFPVDADPSPQLADLWTALSAALPTP